MGETTKCEHCGTELDAFGRQRVGETGAGQHYHTACIFALRARLSAAEREREAAFARGVEAAAKVVDAWNVGGSVHNAAVVAAIRALAHATDAGKES